MDSINSGHPVAPGYLIATLIEFNVTLTNHPDAGGSVKTYVGDSATGLTMSAPSDVLAYYYLH
jgi:hypothetical protein